MWTRKQLKETLKKVLHDSYFKCLLVSIILILISDGIIGGSFHMRFQLNINGHIQTVEMGCPSFVLVDESNRLRIIMDYS